VRYKKYFALILVQDGKKKEKLRGDCRAKKYESEILH
jgi:hypothetical protein